MNRFPWLVISYAAIALAFCRPPVSLADQLKLEVKTLFEQSLSRDLRLSPDGAAIELEAGELFEDDGPAAGYSYQPNEEKLSSRIWIKKELIIPNPQAKQATLLVGPGGMLQAIINGKPHELQRLHKTGNYWDAYSIPPDALKKGKNEIILHGAGRVWIARDDEFAAGSTTRPRHPNRSARSTDGGKTWDYGHLGARANLDGEYYVRLFLDHYRPRGVLTLPVIDLGNLNGKPVANPLKAIGPVHIGLKAESGKAGRFAVRVRFGATPIPAAASWSAWQMLPPGGKVANPAGRYLQISVTLSTTDPLQSPKLNQVLVETTPAYSSDWANKLQVVEDHNETIVRTSIPFRYEPFDHPRLKALRTRYRLDEVVKGSRSELELMARLAGWSAKLWDRGHLKEIYPAWDALKILARHADGRPVGGFCQQYNLVFLQACESFGLPGRAVSISPGDRGGKIRGGHEVVEIWSNDYRKWIHVDGNTGWYLIDKESKAPLSLLELRRRQLASIQGKATRPIQVVTVAKTRHAWKGLQAWPPFAELRLIPRSNFLQEKAPLPLNQGMRGWFWTGHHVWTDADAPAALLYGNRIGNRNNWSWTLNQAHFSLEATRQPGELRVHLDTETPGFDTFLARVDARAAQPVASGFVWKLHPGKNRLVVQPRNLAGRKGIQSRMVLKYR